MTINDLYSQVCTVLLEDLPTGLTTGVLTQAQFLDYAADVIYEFVQKAGLVKRPVSLPVVAGTSTYAEPDFLMQVQEALYNERYIHRETGLSEDFLVYNWRGKSGSPSAWHEDRLAVKNIELLPNPSLAGNTVGTSAALFGTISSTASATDFNIVATTALFGVIASYTGPVYLSTPVAAFGTIANMVPSTANLTMLGTIKPLQKSFALTDLIEIVPDSFFPYLKYGVLAKVFSMDGEVKDVLRARYCNARFQEGINIAQAVSQELLEDQQEVS